jgi:hypothetical protein
MNKYQRVHLMYDYRYQLLQVLTIAMSYPGMLSISLLLSSGVRREMENGERRKEKGEETEVKCCGGSEKKTSP